MRCHSAVTYEVQGRGSTFYECIGATEYRGGGKSECQSQMHVNQKTNKDQGSMYQMAALYRPSEMSISPG